MSLALIEYFLVDTFFIFQRISNDFRDALLLFFAVGYIMWFDEFKHLFRHKKMFIVIPFFLIVIYIFQLQQKNHLELFQKPTIKSLSTSQVTQGDTLTIVGRGFGDSWQQGTVYAGPQVLSTETWSNERIVAKIPIPPEYTTYKLRVVNSEGLESNSKDLKFFIPTRNIFNRIINRLKRTL